MSAPPGRSSLDWRWQLAAVALLGWALGLLSWVFDVDYRAMGLAIGLVLVVGTLLVYRLTSARVSTGPRSSWSDWRWQYVAAVAVGWGLGLIAWLVGGGWIPALAAWLVVLFAVLMFFGDSARGRR